MSDSSSNPDPSDESGRGSIRYKRWIALVVLGIVLVGLALPKLNGSADETDTEEDEAPMGVDVTVIRPGTVTNRLRATGTLRADESVDLISEASGRLVEIRFDEGERVEAGDLLAKINDAELQAEKKRLAHELELAERQAQRQRQLLDEEAISQEQYDQTANEVEVLRAQLERVEAQIEKTEVRAPFSGTVGLRRVSKGSYLTAQTVITTLQRVDPIKVDFSVPEKHAGRVRAGQPISFRVRGSDRSGDGTVYATETAVDTDTRTLRVRARASNASGRLRPGMFADVTLMLGQTDDALVVPTVSIVPTIDGQRVFVVERGQAQPRNVTLGVRSDSTVQVTEGLSVRDTVITSGIQELRAGLSVRIESID